jgi:hypothetical protein
LRPSCPMSGQSNPSLPKQRPHIPNLDLSSLVTKVRIVTANEFKSVLRPAPFAGSNFIALFGLPSDFPLTSRGVRIPDGSFLLSESRDAFSPETVPPLEKFTPGPESVPLGFVTRAKLTPARRRRRRGRWIANRKDTDS